MYLASFLDCRIRCVSVRRSLSCCSSCDPARSTKQRLQEPSHHRKLRRGIVASLGHDAACRHSSSGAATRSRSSCVCIRIGEVYFLRAGADGPTAPAIQDGLQSKSSAKVAELADAPDLGSGSRKALGVRLPPFAILTAELLNAEGQADTGTQHSAHFAGDHSVKTEFIDVSDTQQEPRGRDPEHGGRRRDRQGRARLQPGRAGSPGSGPARCRRRWCASGSAIRFCTTWHTASSRVRSTRRCANAASSRSTLPTSATSSSRKASRSSSRRASKRCRPSTRATTVASRSAARRSRSTTRRSTRRSRACRIAPPATNRSRGAASRWAIRSCSISSARRQRSRRRPDAVQPARRHTDRHDNVTVDIGATRQSAGLRRGAHGPRRRRAPKTFDVQLPVGLRRPGARRDDRDLRRHGEGHPHARRPGARRRARQGPRLVRVARRAARAGPCRPRARGEARGRARDARRSAAPARLARHLRRPSSLVDREIDRRVEEFVRRLVEQQIDPTQGQHQLGGVPRAAARGSRGSRAQRARARRDRPARRPHRDRRGNGRRDRALRGALGPDGARRSGHGSRRRADLPAFTQDCVGRRRWSFSCRRRPFSTPDESAPRGLRRFG